jgi:acetyl-CoA C-acetyltransferase
MISFPYTKRHSAQWNVDQAAAVLVTSRRVADDLGVPAGQAVHPHASVVANHAVPLSERAELHRGIGAEVAAPRVLELAGLEASALGPVDLYSCFPSAVEVLAGALGLPLDDPARALTVTGGLAFAGGPLNNYVIGALVELVRRLRAEPGSFGLSTSVSGFLVKQGFSIWSTEPPERGVREEDVSDQVAAATATVPVVAEGGPGTIASYTVDGAPAAPERAVALVDLPGGRRTIAVSTDADLARELLAADPIGTSVRVDADGGLHRH